MTVHDKRAAAMRAQGYDPVAVMLDGCPLKAAPHVCANCHIRETRPQETTHGTQ